MNLNPPRMLADWAQDATHGINALLPTVPRDVGDPLPENLALIVAEADDGDAARSQLPATRPCCVVSCDHVTNLDGQVETVTADGKVRLRFRIAIDNKDTAAAVAALGIYLRAATWSIRRYTDPRINAEHAANRTRNGIYIQSLLGETPQEMMATAIDWAKDQQNTQTVVGYVLATFQARDLTPTG